MPAQSISPLASRPKSGTNKGLDFPTGCVTSTKSSVLELCQQLLPKEGQMYAVLLKSKTTPRVIREMLSRAGGLTAQARHQLEQDLKLSWYYGGLSVACIDTKDGPGVVASGADSDVRETLGKLNDSELAEITVVFPETFEVQVASFRRQPRMPVRR